MKITRLFGFVSLTLAILAGLFVGSQWRASQVTGLRFDGERLADVVAAGMPSTDGADTRVQGVVMLDVVYERLNEQYYKPIDDDRLIAGVRTGLASFLKSKKLVLSAPALAPGDAIADERQANSLLESAFDHYAVKLGADNIIGAAISGMLATLNDPYSVYMSRSDARAFNETLSGGDFGGIGVYIEKDPKTKQTVVLSPIAGSPAAKAGIAAGDTFVDIDGHIVASATLDDIMGYLRGKNGTQVEIVVARTVGKTVVRKTYRVIRAQIHVPSVAYRMLPGSIGYVALSVFGDGSSDEIAHALRALKSQGAHAYVLDLRNNGGGLLTAAINISSDFIAAGPIVSTVDRAGKSKTAYASGATIVSSPLAVLVNQYTASASEITAGALQDTAVGTIVGVKTFGKGVVQSVFAFPDTSQFKITTERYVTPLGRDLNKKGVVPDVIVPMDPRDVGIVAKDVQLAAALRVVKAALDAPAHQ